MKAATGLMNIAWKTKKADQSNPFDEPIEYLWMNQWLFYANTVRFASAMGGGGDYGVFADGRYQMTKKLFELDDWYRSATGNKP